MTDFVLAIDGGGTSCRAALARLGGPAETAVLGRGKAGSANILTDPQGAVGSIVEAAKAALADAATAGVDVASLDLAAIPAFLGLAGNNVARSVEDVKARLPFRAFVIESDAIIALEGAHGPADGTVAILGTGAAYLTRRGGEIRSKGGWGFVLADLGSGARLGHALLQESLLVHDRIRPATALTDGVLAEFGRDPSAIVAFAHSARPRDFGRFAPRMFEAADAGDRTALSLIRDGARAIDETLDAIMLEGACPVCLLGGLAALYPPYLSDQNRARLVEPIADALTGSVALARRHFAGSGGLAA